MKSTATCYAWERHGKWDAVCVDYDLAAQGESFEQVRRELGDAIKTYLSCVAELTEPERSRFLNRRAPLLLRTRLAALHRPFPPVDSCADQTVQPARFPCSGRWHSCCVEFRQVVEILKEYDITFSRNGKGSHKVYQGTHSGQLRIVVLSYDQLGDDVPKGTLENIKRQSGIPKERFRR